MKKNLLFIVLAVTLLACNAPKQTYRVSGTIAQMKEGSMLVLAFYDRNSVDTICRVAISEGKFNFQGEMKYPRQVQLVLEGRNDRMTVFLEGGGDFKITWSGKERKIEGGVEQAVLGQLQMLDGEIRTRQRAIQLEYKKAESENDTQKVDSLQSLIKEEEIRERKEVHDFIRSHSSSYAIGFYMREFIHFTPLEELKARYALLDETIKVSTYGQEINYYITRMDAIAIGRIAPDFTIKTPEGAPISLHGIQGKLKLLDFWASWCAPCRWENKHVLEIYKEYHSKGLEVFSVSLDRDKEAWIKAIADDGLIWAHGSDLIGYWKSLPAELYVVESVPQTVLLDENNRIIARNVKGDKLREMVAERLLK